MIVPATEPSQPNSERLMRFEAAQRAIDARTSSYVALNEMTAVSPGYVDPESLLRTVFAAHIKRPTM